MTRIAYADPPYPGMAAKFYSHDPRCSEVDHRELMARLDGEFESWSLSTASTTLQAVLSVAPSDVRIAAWVKPFASFKPGVNPAYTWEPVLFKTKNRYDKSARTIRDHLTIEDAVECNITLKRGLTGAKPEGFCFWMFELVGAHPDDEFVDLFPGTGGVTLAWEKWRSRWRAPMKTESLFEGAA